MLNSKDTDAVNAGLKSLAMMDYAHYTNSIIYMLNRTNGNYRWCKASNSNAVKFMMNTLCGENRIYRRNMYLKESMSIFQEDYELYKQMVDYFNKDVDRTVYDLIRFTNFMTISPEGMLVPRLKETA